MTLSVHVMVPYTVCTGNDTVCTCNGTIYCVQVMTLSVYVMVPYTVCTGNVHKTEKNKTKNNNIICVGQYVHKQTQIR